MFDIRRLEFYKNKNTFTGSCDAFRYRIQPKDELFWCPFGNRMFVMMQAEEVQTVEFPLSEEGFSQVAEWLERQYQKQENTLHSEEEAGI